VKVLVTGVAGFIGSNLADYLLARRYHVVGIDDLSYGVREQIPDDVEFHRLDVRSCDIYPVFSNIDTVFHLAAKNCISDCQLDPVQTSDINITGTVNVFEASRRTEVRKVIYAETSAIYENAQVLPTPETEIAPQSFYAISKLCTMSFAKAYEVFFGLNITALRYFNVYGPRQDYRRMIPPVMSAFIIKLLKGERPIIYGSGEKRRDFVYVDDVNDFHILAMTDPRTNGNTYNIGSGANYSIREIFDLIEGILHTGIEPIYKDDLPGEAETTLADTSKAKALGWRPKVDIQEGLERSIEYIKKVMSNE